LHRGSIKKSWGTSAAFVTPSMPGLVKIGRYDYVAANACPRETIDEIVEFYRTLFCDPNDPNDANLAAAWSFSGSLLTAGPKCAVALAGAGCSGKTTFTNLMHRTLGEYCNGMFAVRFRRSATIKSECRCTPRWGARTWFGSSATAKPFRSARRR
jgi:hypothetical protein